VEERKREKVARLQKFPFSREMLPDDRQLFHNRCCQMTANQSYVTMNPASKPYAPASCSRSFQLHEAGASSFMKLIALERLASEAEHSSFILVQLEHQDLKPDSQITYNCNYLTAVAWWQLF